jgi:4-amino-4-deoxy-L-arabinose transferase-like glycosyltransferase
MTEAGGFGWRTLRAVALALIAVKLVLLVLAHPFMDETYYFMWGHHPALSYFDHPALIGWTQGIAGLLFGWSVAGLRAMVLLSFVGDVALLHLLARELGGERRSEAFWIGTLLLLATPILFGLTSVALPDHLLIFFTLLGVYAAERLRRTPEAIRWIYLAAIAIGAATLSKYTGALLGLAAILHLAVTPALRPLWRSPHLYFATALALAMQAPVLVWNLRHGFASLAFITGGRHGLPASFDLSGLWGFLLGAVAVLSPFLLWPLGRFVFGREDGHGFARIVFWLSSLGFLAASFFTNILVHWNVVAYAAVLPFLAPVLRSRLLVGAQILYGVLAIVIAATNYAVLPVTALIGGRVDQTSAWSYGWDEIAEAVRDIEKTATAGFVAGTDYALAAPLGFALADADVTSLSPGRDAYDDWFDPVAHKGQDAIIVADRWRPLRNAIAARFASVETVRSVSIVRLGRTLDTYTIYLARGFGGPE